MPLKMSVTLPNGGLAVAGYKFPIQVAIANGTNYAIRCIKISFRQNIGKFLISFFFLRILF